MQYRRIAPLAVASSCVLDPDQAGGWPDGHETKQTQKAHSEPKLMNLPDSAIQTWLGNDHSRVDTRLFLQLGKSPALGEKSQYQDACL